jgi:hypothetical protein
MVLPQDMELREGHIAMKAENMTQKLLAADET